MSVRSGVFEFESVVMAVRRSEENPGERAEHVAADTRPDEREADDDTPPPSGVGERVAAAERPPGHPDDEDGEAKRFKCETEGSCEL